MRRAKLTRIETGDQGTFGEIEVECSQTRLVCVELPWRGNTRGKSCIPAGRYLFRWRTDSPKHGACYEEWDDPNTPDREDVEDRDNIQIHAANLAGDETVGYVSQLLGCIAPGVGFEYFKAGQPPAGDREQKGVVASKTALKILEKELKHEDLELAIEWAEGVLPE